VLGIVERGAPFVEQHSELHLATDSLNPGQPEESRGVTCSLTLQRGASVP
jgi:hypothetical protein